MTDEQGEVLMTQMREIQKSLNAIHLQLVILVTLVLIIGLQHSGLFS